MKFKHGHITIPARSRPRPGFLSWILLSILLLTGLALSTTAKDDAAPRPNEGVQMIIDYGDGVQKHFTALSWKKGMTGLDALNQAKRHPRGIRFSYRGKGARGFLTAIDGLKNEGQGKNWIYRVNGKLGDRSFAIQTLNPGDVTLWNFGQYK
ncbi:MAG: DUF4430 domain-containing protein [Planctomycetota bacterium]|nr:DUF4430 domain-containing protein [Planctomycetota bacterium]